jgi:hypothetical protein
MGRELGVVAVAVVCVSHVDVVIVLFLFVCGKYACDFSPAINRHV